MLRKGLYFTFIVYVFSLFIWQNVSHAYPSGKNWTTVESNLTIAYTNLDTYVTFLKETRDAVTTLNSGWEANKTKIEDGEKVMLETAAAALVGIVSTALTSGSSAVAYAPSIFTGWIAAKAGLGTGKHKKSKTKYLTAMSTAVSAFDIALGDVNEKYKIYESAHDAYLTSMASHSGGLVLYDKTTQTTSDVYSKEDLKTAVTEGKTENKTATTRDWYHTWESPSSSTYHSITPFYTKAHLTIKDLPKTEECYGSCSDLYRTFYEAWNTKRRKCGTSTRHTTDDFVLSQRTLAEGCGKIYYSCDTKEAPDHKIRWCKKDFIDAMGVEYLDCGRRFRRCMKKVFDHNLSDLLPALFSKHSDEEDNDDGDDSADAGDGSSSAMHACGIHATTVSGSHSQITPPCGDSAHAGYACQISSDHNTAMSGWSGTFYECQPHTDYPCGHTDPTANSAYHAPQASCLVTNANGDSCTVTGFYGCQSHTHVYPAPTISCGRSGCSQTVTSSTQHSATCASGHSYWTCNPSDVSLHITRTCRLSTCGKSWERCSTVGGTPLCDDPWRRSNGLPCWKK